MANLSKEEKAALIEKGLGENTNAVKDDALNKVSTEENSIEKQTQDTVNEAMQRAAATAALKAAITSSAEITQREADKKYVTEKKRYMLNKCKSDRKVEFIGSKIYAQYLGETYSFLFNTIPVVIKFDGSKQELPEFIYNHLMKKLAEISESNTNVINIEKRM